MMSHGGQLRRDLLLAYRNRGEMINPLVFFVMVVTLVAFSVGPEERVLAPLAGGIIWVMALLASLLSTDSLFRADYEDGSLEQFLLAPGSLYFPVLTRVLAHWLVTGLPLALAAPLLALMLKLPAAGLGTLLLALLPGTLLFSTVGAAGAALTLSARRGGLLLSLVVMPLYIPVLIFGTAAVNYAVEG